MQKLLISIGLICVFSSTIIFSFKTEAAEVKINLIIQESKIVYASRVESFNILIQNQKEISLLCRDRSFYLTSVPSLYSGWDVTKASDFSEILEDSKFREYIFASCRNADPEVLAWFPRERSSPPRLQIHF